MSLFNQLFGNIGGTNKDDAPAPAGTPGNLPPPAPEPEGLDKFTADINFTPDPDKAPKPFDPSTLIEVDPEALQTEVKKLNFVEGVITEQDAASIMEGGEKSLAAMVNVLNKFGQQLYTRSALASRTIAGTTLEKSLSHVDERITKSMNDDKVFSTLSAENPALAHPAAQLMVKNIVQQMQLKYPEASPQEIKTKANEYFLEFAKTLNPTATKETETPEGTDWVDFLKG